jgi:hypothetical protein
MMDRIISQIRVWHFGHTCRRDPARIGLELRRLLVELRGAELRSQALDLKLSGNGGKFPGALGAVAESRWKITNSAEIARVFESLTKEQQVRLCSAVSLILPWRRG